jgi:hypothetical protein
MMLNLLDIFFVVFHTSLIIFNLFGWTLQKTRKLNLITLILTGASWFILGLFYGIGYCPLTDWHYTILNKLGHTSLPHSYIKYLIERIFAIDINPNLIDKATFLSWLIALLVSAGMNIRNLKLTSKS